MATTTLLCTLSTGGFALDITEAVTTAIENNPDILSLMHNKQAVEQRLKHAKGGYLPEVSLRASTGYGYINNSTSRGRDSRQEGDGPYRGLIQTDGEVAVTQMLFDGFETKHEVGRQTHRSQRAHWRLVETQERVAMDAIRAYMNILKFEEIVQLSEENVDINKRYLAQMEERLKYKSGSLADIQQVKSRLARATARLSNNTSSLKQAHADFKRATTIQAKDLKNPERYALNLPTDLDEVLEKALSEHPAIRMSQQDILIAEEVAKKEKADLFPSLELELASNASQNQDASKGFDNDYTALVNLRYDLYTGGKDIAAYREQLRRFDEAKETAAQTRMNVERDLYQTHARLVSENERFDQFKQQVDAADETWQSYQKQFKLGMRSLMDLLDSENELFVAKANLIRSRYDRQILAHEWHQRQGELMATLGL